MVERITQALGGATGEWRAVPTSRAGRYDLPMKRQKFEDLQRLWAVEARRSDLSLWWMARDVRQKLGPRASEDDVRARTLDLLKPLLDAGELRAAGLLPDGKFAEWKGSIEDQLHRIDADWRGLGRQPALGEIVWFIRARGAGGASGWRILGYSLLCGAVTSAATGPARMYLPKSRLADSLLDALARPGPVILSAMLGQRGSRWYWGYAALAVSFMVYSCVWLAFLLLFRPRR